MITKQMMAAATPMALTEDDSCGYCLQRLAHMTDPRELPCSHVFCLPCLQADFRTSRALQCTYCGETHNQINLENLPKLGVPAVQQQTNGETSLHQREESRPCDVCENFKKPSVCFCTDCNKKLCNEHFNMHELFLNKSHRTIDIDAFSESPTKYKVEKCPDHSKHELNRACTKCYRTFCSACPTDTICRASRGRRDTIHSITQLERFAQSLREQIREVMRSLSNKIAKTGELEKASWGNLDDVEVNVEEMNKELDRITEEQITEIRRKTAELKDQMKIHLTHSTHTVEQFAATIMATKEHIQDLWKSANRLVTQASDTEVIARQQETVQELSQAVQAELKPCKTFKGALTPTEKCRNIELKFELSVSLPTTLKLSRGSDVDCFSVCWTEDNHLVTCGSGNITLFDSKMIEVKSTVVRHSYSVASWGPGFVVMSFENSEYTPTVYTKDLNYSKRLEPFPSSFIQQLAVNAFTSQIYAVDTKSGHVKIYGKDGRLLRSSSLGSDTLMGIHVLADGHLIVSDYKHGSISKYQPSHQQGMQKVWTCEGLTSPTGMCSDAAGYIYVAGIGLLYLVSDEGKLVRTMTHPTLTGIALHDVSIAGDQIALACTNDGVKTFQLC